LKGYDIRGKQERLVATLFADDTIVYLDHTDDFGTLVEVLDEWCIAAGAKFNIAKTEMIPIGTPDHRDRVRATRFVNGLGGPLIPDHIKIAAEGEPIRTLGKNRLCAGPLGTWTPDNGRQAPHYPDGRRGYHPIPGNRARDARRCRRKA